MLLKGTEMEHTELSKLKLYISDNEVSYKTDSSVVEIARKNQVELAKKITDLLIERYHTPDMSMERFYQLIDRELYISVSTIKKIFQCKYTISRDILYKIAVGLKMDIETADYYFGLSMEGPLNHNNLTDLIVINALEDGDSLDDMLLEFVEYLKRKG